MNDSYVSFFETHIRRLAAALGIPVEVLNLPIPAPLERVDVPALFTVWIDLTFGEEPADWQRNTDPQPLAGALAEAHELRSLTDAQGGPWICKVVPE